MKIGTRVIKGLRPSKRYQRYFDNVNRLYFDGELTPTKVYTAPLLKITALSQTEALEDENWVDAGEYGILCTDERGDDCIIVDRGTSIFHAILTKQTVLHEAIHKKVWPYKGHGRPFTKEIRRIAALGAFDDLI